MKDGRFAMTADMQRRQAGRRGGRPEDSLRHYFCGVPDRESVRRDDGGGDAEETARRMQREITEKTGCTPESAREESCRNRNPCEEARETA